jgi:hypothetical protein
VSTPSHPVQAGTTGGYTRSWRHTDTTAGINHDTDDGSSGEVWRSELAELLGEVPQEALLDGPPDDDLVLRRALRQMRSETAARRRRRHLPRLLAIVALLAGGVAIGPCDHAPRPSW